VVDSEEAVARKRTNEVVVRMGEDTWWLMVGSRVVVIARPIMPLARSLTI
jgi:hypothetical protein